MPIAVPGARALRGLAALVSTDQLMSLLSARAPGLLDEDSDSTVVTETLRGISAEVTAIVGATFATTDDLDALELAVWTVTVGAAASIEGSLFPEQQLGDGSRAETLQTKYLSLLKSLTSYVGSSGPEYAGRYFTVPLGGDGP